MYISMEKFLSKYKTNLNTFTFSKLFISIKCRRTNKVTGFYKALLIGICGANLLSTFFSVV